MESKILLLLSMTESFQVIIWLIVNSMDAMLRGFIEYGSITLADGALATQLRLLPVFLFVASVARLFFRRRYLLAACVLAADLYFVYNRLTVFAVRPLNVAELVGNIGLIGLAILLTLPQKIDKPRIPKRRRQL